MRAYEIVSAGGVDALALSERDPPRPGHGEVLVRGAGDRGPGTVGVPEPRGAGAAGTRHGDDRA